MIAKKTNFVGIVFIFLIFVWLYFVITHLISIGYFSATLEGGLTDKFLGDYRGDPLMKGDVVLLDYPSRYPMFGMMEVRFNTFNRDNDDVLEFRIKKPGEDNWYYKETYKSIQFQTGKVFPFGFPVIADSNGKTYHIEIESLHGSTESAVSIKTPLFKSVIVGKHVFSMEQLSSNPKLFVYFIYHKILNILNNPEHFFHLFLYSLPLIFFTAYMMMGMNIGIFTAIAILSILADVFWIDEYYSFLIISVLLAWLLNTYQHKACPRVSISLGLVFLILSVPLGLVQIKIIPDKLAAWSYLLLFFGIIQTIYEASRPLVRSLSVLVFWQQVFLELKNALVFVYLCLMGDVRIVATRIDEIRGNREASQMVALIIYRFDNVIVKNYIVTTKALSFLLVFAVQVQRYTVNYGPFVLLIWLITSLIGKVTRMKTFFQDYFIRDQLQLFWTHLGAYLLVLFLVVSLIFYISQRRKRFKVKLYLAILFLALYSYMSDELYSRTTYFRNDLVIWSVNPQDISEPWADVTVVGRNFKNMPSMGSVLIDGVPQRIIKWNEREVIFRTDPTTTTSGPLIIKTYQNKKSDPITFTYTGNN